MIFKVDIELGNVEMTTPRDVALALETLAARLRRLGHSFHPTEGKLRDGNGNTVGAWSVDHA